MPRKIIALASCLAVLTACSMVPAHDVGKIEIPSRWSMPQNTDSAEIAKDWWKTFGSEELNALMAQALVGNNDLRAGVHRIEQARAGLKIAGASLYPSADASGGTNRERLNGNTGGTSWNAGAGITYELDLFGANRATIAGARANLAATQYGEDALSLIVMGDVAQTYFNVLTARERVAIADKNLKNAREVLRIVQARFDVGTESALETAQQKVVVSTSEAARASLEKQRILSENALAVLLGMTPQTLAIQTHNLYDLTIPAINAGQPSSLVLRRPDLRAAETDLMVAEADIGVARAQFFPMVNLGLDWSIGAAGFGDPTTTALSLLSSLTAPIFQGGRLQGGVEQATARQQELVETYHKTILVSFQEVEDALAGVTAAQKREDALNTAQKEAQRAYDLSKNQYDAGTIDFRSLLDTQAAMLNAQDSYAQARLERLTAAVDLYKALGGGWYSEQGMAVQETVTTAP